MPFMIDTGLSLPMLIDGWAAKELKLTANVGEFDLNHGARSGSVARLKKAELVSDPDAIPPLATTLKVDAAAIVENMLPIGYASPLRLAGVIGMPALSSSVVTFDFAAKTLILFPPENLPPMIKGATVLPLIPLDTRFTVALPTADDKTIDFLLDTGSQWVVMAEKLAKHFKVTVTPPVISDEFVAAGAQSVNTRLLSEFILGDKHEPNVVLHTVDNDKQRPLVGMSVLSRFRITIDARHRQLLLEPGTDYAARCRLPGLPAVLAQRKQDHYTVYDLLADSTAAKAGVLVGDVIISVDGKEIASLPDETVQLLLDGIVGTEAELVLARKDNPMLALHYKRQSLFAMASGRDVGVGIAQTITASGKMLVTALQQHSSAMEAGIEVGDEIVSIAGLPVSTTPMAELAVEMKKPEGAVIVLKLLRHKDNKLYEVKLTVRRVL